jgi:O-antigen ligase
MQAINNYKNTNFKDYISLILLATFPLALIFGNLLINLYIFLFSINFLVNFQDNKIIFKDKIFYLLAFFLISLLINVFFSVNIENSLPRVIKIIFIIFFIFEIKRLIRKYETTHMTNVYKSWFLIFSILTIDIIFETIFGYNFFGNVSYMPGRIASFFNTELVAGAFYQGFVLFFLSYLILKKTKNHVLIFFVIAVIIVSFLIGERSNFLKLFLSVIFFISFVLNINYKIKIISFATIVLIFCTILISSNSYKVRYYGQIKSLLSVNGYSNFIKQSQYGAHRNAAIKILNKNLFFGVGVKNFRSESGKKMYENKDYLRTSERQSTHPHQIHYEFLSETGIFGYLSFLIFIISSIYLGLKSYIKSKNLYQLSAIIFIIINLLPLLPTGSFLSTFFSGIFWLNFAIMNGYIKKRTKF